MLARATRPPNSIISGSFWNCGAPPDRTITVAIVSAPMMAPRNVAIIAASQSIGAGDPANSPIERNTVSVTTAMNA